MFELIKMTINPKTHPAEAAVAARFLKALNVRDDELRFVEFECANRGSRPKDGSTDVFPPRYKKGLHKFCKSALLRTGSSNNTMGRFMPHFYLAKAHMWRKVGIRYSMYSCSAVHVCLPQDGITSTSDPTKTVISYNLMSAMPI